MVRPTGEAEAQQVWQVNRRHAGLWRSWDGEVVVYDDSSGDTLKLDVIMTEAFTHLLQGPTTHAQLCAHLASAFDLDVNLRLQDLATLVLDRFERAGLVEPAGTSGPAAGGF